MKAISQSLFLKHIIEQQTPGKFITGAFNGDTLIGICSLAREDVKKAYHRGSIIQMYVRQQCSGKGCGLALLRAAAVQAFSRMVLSNLYWVL